MLAALLVPDPEDSDSASVAPFAAAGLCSIVRGQAPVREGSGRWTTMPVHVASLCRNQTTNSSSSCRQLQIEGLGAGWSGEQIFCPTAASTHLYSLVNRVHILDQSNSARKPDQVKSQRLVQHSRMLSVTGTTSVRTALSQHVSCATCTMWYTDLKVLLIALQAPEQMRASILGCTKLEGTPRLSEEGTP